MYEEPKLIRDNLLPVTEYLLGRNDNALNKLNIDQINRVLSELLVSLRYPSGASPLNITIPQTELVDVFKEPERHFVRMDNFLDRFDTAAGSSIMGRFFSLLQKEALAHLHPAETYNAYCTPIQIGGNKLGFLAYFPDLDLKLEESPQFDLFDPFQSHTMADNARNFYKHFYQNTGLPGSVILYLYSAETNAYFLTSGKGVLPLTRFPSKQAVKNFRAKLLQDKSAADQHPPLAPLEPRPPVNADMQRILYMVLRLAQYCCLQIWETKKNYANKFIRDRIGHIEEGPVPYHHIFESLSWFVSFSAAVSWAKTDNGQWTIKEAQQYIQHPDDPQECFLKLLAPGKDLLDFENNYRPLREQALAAPAPLDDHLTHLFDKREPVLEEVQKSEKTRLLDLLAYSGKPWAADLDCANRFVIPVNDQAIPGTIIELYFHEGQRGLQLIIFDIARMIARLYAILKHEFNFKLLHHQELKRRYMGKLAHEIKNWFPQVMQKVNGLENLIGPQATPEQLRQAEHALGFARTRLGYFSDIFETVMAEFRGEKYPLLKKTVHLNQVMQEVKETVIDLCLYDANYRAHLAAADALDIPATAQGDARLKAILEQAIALPPTDLTNHMNETLIFTCLQEILKNAVLHQNWQSQAGFTLQAGAPDENHLAVQVTNTPRQDDPHRLAQFARALVQNETFRTEGFGTMWLKSIQQMLGGTFQVPPQWLDPDADHPAEFSLTFVFPRQTNNEEG